MMRSPITRWLIITLGLAVVFHFGAMAAYPHVIMAGLNRTLAEGTGSNTPIVGRLPDETSRTVVRPSPDLAYTICAFDLSQGPLRIAATLPDTYASLSMYAANSDVFYVRNNQTAGKTVSLVLTADSHATEEAGTVVSPTETGIILARMLVSARDDYMKVLPHLQSVTCTPVD